MDMQEKNNESNNSESEYLPKDIVLIYVAKKHNSKRKTQRKDNDKNKKREQRNE
jgi:hypothetical protein